MNYTPLKTNQNKSHKKPLLLLVGVLFLVFSTLAGGYFVLRGRTNITERAAAPSPSPTIKKNLASPTSITGGVCRADESTCSWSPPTGATSDTTYTYKIIDQASGVSVAFGTTSALLATFPSETGHTYQCNVTPKNNCGEGVAISTVATCSASNSLKTLKLPTSTDSAMVALAGVTTTPMTSPTPTTKLLALSQTSPTVTPSATPTPTATRTPTVSTTPTPTEIIIAQNLPSVTVTAAPTSSTISMTPTSTITSTTTTPTVIAAMPTAGTMTGIYFAVLSTLLLITLLFVF